MKNKNKNQYIFISGGTSEISEKIIESLISENNIIFSYNGSLKKASIIELKKGPNSSFISVLFSIPNMLGQDQPSTFSVSKSR